MPRKKSVQKARSSRIPSNKSRDTFPPLRGERKQYSPEIESKSTETTETTEIAPFPGYVDFFGYCSAAGGWLFSGWVARPFTVDQCDPVDFVAQYDRTQINGRALISYYQRSDLDQNAIGVIVFLPHSDRVHGILQHIAFSVEGVQFQASAGDGTTQFADRELVDRVRPTLINQAFANRNREHLLNITSRLGFAGQDTLTTLSEPVRLEIDEAIFCPPCGLLLKGWQLFAPGAVKSFRVRSGPLAGEIVLADAIQINRPDVIEAVGLQAGFSAVRCGFIAYVSDCISQGDHCYIEVELANGEIGFKNFKVSMRSGIDAIRHILDGIDIRFADIDSAFDKVLGPAIFAINARRLEQPAVPTEIDFGQAPDDPKFTFIIPLYGRVDFLEYQMALFTRHHGIKDTEIIYVLDDPTKQLELETLSSSTHERFRIPFRLLMLPTNTGFASASNVGLRAARGEYICFLNSDIFPITLDWIERLAERLQQQNDLGAVGPRLLFEDGSIQHEGCFYRKIPEFGNWTFTEHYNKGRRPEESRGLQRCDAITAACMVLKRSLAQEIGGFDESFVVGDFEDSDLCLELKSRGLCCAIDQDVEMYHLERKSQIGPSQSWRMNLTLYNAWLHQRCWGSVL